MVFFFFFKQKTAYELRISDWSSDVCSSDLEICVVLTHLDCCGRGFDAQSHVDEVRAALKRWVGDWVVEMPVWCINSLNPDDCTPPLNWLLERHALIVSSTACIPRRSEEHTSELQSLMRISYAVFCLKKTNKQTSNCY